MRIGIDFRLAGTKHGGIGRYILEVVKQFLTMNFSDELFIFYHAEAQTLVEELQAFAPHNRQVKWIPVNIRHYSVAEQLILPRILNKYRLDIMHFPNFNVPVQYKGKFIVTIHDLIHHKLGGVKKSNWLHFRAYKYIMKHAVMASQKIITVSHASKADIVNEYAVPANKVQVIYEAPFPPQEFTSEQASELKQRYLMDNPYFLFVGVKQRNKNLPKLCEAFNLFIQHTQLKFDLVMAGKKDSHYPEISQACLKVCKNQLIFIEHFTDVDLEILYQNAFAFVSASGFEGFGLPGLEAMSRGLPLAVSNLPVFNEIYENGAIYFDPENIFEMAECFKILANDLPYYNQIREVGLKRAKQFSWQKCAEETWKQYENILTF